MQAQVNTLRQEKVSLVFVSLNTVPLPATLTNELFSFQHPEGAVSVRARHYAPEGEKTSINCSVTDEAFTGWFDSSGRKITSDSSQRIHVREDGSLNYLEISKVNRTDRGTYECRGKTNKEPVLLLVECMYHKRERKGTKSMRAL